MNQIKRTRGIRKIIRVSIFRGSIEKHVTAGSWACEQMMREASKTMPFHF